MMKKRLFGFLLISVLLLSLSSTAYAKSSDWSVHSNVVNAQMQSVVANDNTSKIRGTARGRVISSVELQLSDEGGGVIGVYASTLCHTAVKEIYMTMYLDVWDEDIQDWVMVDNYEYRWRASDNPDKDLSAVSVSFLLEDLPRGRMYSLRGAHAAKNFDNVMEVMASETSGIILD